MGLLSKRSVLIAIATIIFLIILTQFIFSRKQIKKTLPLYDINFNEPLLTTLPSDNNLFEDIASSSERDRVESTAEGVEQLFNTTGTDIDTTENLLIAPSEQYQVESISEGVEQLSDTTGINTTENLLQNNTTRDSTDESFSACILWMDDNHRLDEWLAYHYYLLKLRYVVINIDPWSRTPWSRSKLLEIVDRWNDHENKYNLNMTIVTITDDEYKKDYDGWMEKLQRQEKSLTARDYGLLKTSYHRARQPEFYRHCSLHLIQQNRSWTSFHDNDEFFTFKHTEESSYQKMEQPGYVFDRLNAIKQRNPPPDTESPLTGLSCLVLARRRHCAKELSKEDMNDLFVPSSDDTKYGVIPDGFINSIIGSNDNYDRESIVKRFDTIRYKYLTPGYDGMPKSFIDLSQPHVKQFVDKHSENAWSVHIVMRSLCKDEEKNRLPEVKDILKKENFVLSHFLGSLESYSFRKDARQGGLRNHEKWVERSEQTNGEVMIVIRQWLKGFIELVGGPETASYLLQDAGKFPYYFDVESRIEEIRQIYDIDDPSKTFQVAVDTNASDNTNEKQSSGPSRSNSSSDQPLTIVVQLSGELGNQVLKIGEGFCIRRMIETKLGIKTEIKLRHQDNSKWKNAMKATKEVFPNTRALDFEEANTEDFDEARSFQKSWLQSLAEERKDLDWTDRGILEQKWCGASNGKQCMETLLNMLNQTWHLERPSFRSEDASYSIPHVYTNDFMADECLDLVYTELREFFKIDEEKICKLTPDPDETVLHLRNFKVEMPKAWKDKGFAELGPNKTALELFANSKPGEKVAIISRFPTHLDEYIQALQSLKGLNVRVIMDQKGNQDFCFLAKAQKEMIGMHRSTFAIVAGILGNAKRVRLYAVSSPSTRKNNVHSVIYKFSNAELNERFSYENYDEADDYY